jgi:hypothetical protein
MIRLALAFAAFGFVLALSVSPQTVHNVNAAQELKPW